MKLKTLHSSSGCVYTCNNKCAYLKWGIIHLLIISLFATSSSITIWMLVVFELSRSSGRYFLTLRGTLQRVQKQKYLIVRWRVSGLCRGVFSARIHDTAAKTTTTTRETTLSLPINNLFYLLAQEGPECVRTAPGTRDLGGRRGADALPDCWQWRDCLRTVSPPGPAGGGRSGDKSTPAPASNAIANQTNHILNPILPDPFM